MDEEPVMNRIEKHTCSDTETVHLTPKEHETLHWAMLGKTAWEISRIQDRSEATINFHLGNIRRKFGVCSMRAALMKAIAQGVV
ncbi:helix-turn-helix domain-containing protein [Pseudomonas syringae]|nr:helix-turn-helix domain-containing protein [Pseudomonas syringae]